MWVISGEDVMTHQLQMWLFIGGDKVANRNSCRCCGSLVVMWWLAWLTCHSCTVDELLTGRYIGGSSFLEM